MELKKRLLKIIGIIFTIVGLFSIIIIIKSIVSMDMKSFASTENILDIFVSLLFLYIGYIILRYS
ncbi:hypothetical protein SAMN02745195_00210 [Thermoanaerobacter uzonensis DSM 18761]|uniref:Uncharacterized protein n=1 Tax=Thermoanaerobacter uzonensis DSM 18761 TaxID=1123369 RepID=A0A1M4SNG9_9THEO|nr:hypothetical protein SAMN02745195_00210 [Thermoanaerobacter uzonensis DSM 18761]